MNNSPQDLLQPQRETDRLGHISFTGFSLAAIQIQEGTPEELEQILAQKIDNAHGAYRNTPVVLNVENVSNLITFDFFKLQEICQQHELFLVGVTGIVNEDRADALLKRRIPVVNSKRFNRIRQENLKPKIVTQFLELKIPIQVPVPYKVEVPYKVTVPSPIKIIQRNVRSGETINGKDSSIVIYGSVSAHARIVASQHVFIFGNVNNAELFAGAPNNNTDPGFTTALIHVSGSFNPLLLSIAGNYRTAEDLDVDEELHALRKQQNGIVATLEQNKLKFRSIDTYSMQNQKVYS